MALMDDGNGAEHADCLMSGRMAFCRAYPGQIALIISFRAAQSERARGNAEERWPQQLRSKACVRRIFINWLFLIRLASVSFALDKKSQKGSLPEQY